MITTPAILKHAYYSPSGNVGYLLFQPEHTFTFQEGQFCMIEATVHEKITKKPYSIATTNLLLQKEKLIGFVVKKTSDNGMSDFLTQTLVPGDQVTLKGPVGHYVDPQTHPTYLLVSVGSGLSPNFGLFQHLVTKPDIQLIHLYGERTTQDIVPYIHEQAHLYASDRIRTVFCLSQEIVNMPGYVHGYVQSQLASAGDLLGTKTTCFVCGSPVAVQDIVQQLVTLGVAREDIIIEKW